MISWHNNVTALIAKVVTQLYMYPRDRLTQTATCMILQEFSSHDVFLRNVHPQNLPDDNAELGTNEIHQMHELSQQGFVNQLQYLIPYVWEHAMSDLLWF